jgi:hypothetical protein
MAPIEAVLFSTLMAMVFVWFALILWTFHRLRTKHSETYEAIGSPSLFWNNSMRNNWLFLKFMYGGGWKMLDDRPLARVIRIMQVLLIAYVVVFGLLIANVFGQTRRPAAASHAAQVPGRR